MLVRDRVVIGCGLLFLGWAFGGFSAGPAAAQEHPPTQPPAPAQMKAEKSNMNLVGFNDLQARSAYQPTIHKQGDRWIAYVGHLAGTALNPLTGKMEENGTSIVDVTDPKQPKYLAHIPGEATPTGPGNGAQMVRVCDGSSLPRADRSKVYMLRSFGSSAHEIWDTTDPAKPTRLTVVVSGLSDTHKSFWECGTGIAYLVGGAPGWRVKRMTMVYDLSDPAKPVFIRYFGLPGQQPGATGPVPTELHGMISMPDVNRVYFGYGTDSNGVMQIVDRDKLLKGSPDPTDANLAYPQISRLDLPPDIGSHTAYPLLGMELPEFAKEKPRTPAAAAGVDHVMISSGPPMAANQSTRNFVLSVGETLGNECLDNRQMLRVIDVTSETRPFGVATWTVPEASGNFCSRGGRFGTHSLNENMTPIYYRRVVFISEFNAGVRALDIRDPLNPKEIAYYIPAATDKTDSRCIGQGAAMTCKTAIQTDNAEVDDRGYIYIVDRANTGMHVLELTGAAKQVANWSAVTSQR